MGSVPADVIDGFFGNDTAVIKEIKTGLVNDTYLAETSAGKSILQRLNPIFDRKLIDDMKICCQYLEDNGWDAPVILPATDGSLFLADESDRLWRRLAFIESDGQVPAALSDSDLRAVGNMLARWHKIMANLSYKPLHVIPHFHDTAWHAARLRKNLFKFTDATSKDLGTKVLDAYDALPELPSLPDQLLHGDPQLNNMLFRRGKPFTLIDLDSLMFGPIWYDIGDLLRSMLEADILAGRDAAPHALRQVIIGYFDRPQDDAYRAAQLITLELAMRFLNDIVDDNYFAWDTNRFESRASNHKYRAGVQWQIHKLLEKELNR